MRASSNEVNPEVQEIMKVFAEAGIETGDFPYKESRGELLSCDYGGQLRFTNTASCEWHV